MMNRLRHSRLLRGLALVLLGAGLFGGGTALAGGGNAFTDTPPWIDQHANWLSENQIANGYPDGTFRPNDDITRGQSAFWIGNYNDAIFTVVDSASFTATFNGNAVAYCGGNHRAVMGTGSSDDPNMALNASFSIGHPDFGQGWQVDFESVDGAVHSGNISVTVLCVPAIVGP